ncbi:hypothetical protein NL676_022510 [Syzygium grande]|nr:hypothetical protein NL676_022510 [Syzygium grande]
MVPTRRGRFLMGSARALNCCGVAIQQRRCRWGRRGWILVLPLSASNSWMMLEVESIEAALLKSWPSIDVEAQRRASLGGHEAKAVRDEEGIDGEDGEVVREIKEGDVRAEVR